jgi:beta-xylosidase
VTFEPKEETSLAGIVLFYDDQHFMQFGVSTDTDGSPCLRIKASLGDLQVNSHSWKIKTTKEVRLRAVADGKGHVYFSYLIGGGSAWRNVGMPLSTTQLTSKETNGFTGLMVGLFARE